MNPFVRFVGDAFESNHAVLYRTGDNGYTDGERIFHQGRQDQQVMIGTVRCICQLAGHACIGSYMFTRRLHTASLRTHLACPTFSDSPGMCRNRRGGSLTYTPTRLHANSRGHPHRAVTYHNQRPPKH
jgi:hypothetical protein